MMFSISRLPSETYVLRPAANINIKIKEVKFIS
jgi:hypothetical protein